jgi:hypothetical protein
VGITVFKRWLLAASAGLLFAAADAGAATIAYWRMEVDNDPSATGLSVPNEVAGGSTLLSSEAVLDSSNLPTTIVPLTSDPNNFSVAAAFQGGSNGINASAAWYDELAVTSISLEFWARTLRERRHALPLHLGRSGWNHHH